MKSIDLLVEEDAELVCPLHVEVVAVIEVVGGKTLVAEIIQVDDAIPGTDIACDVEK